MLLETLDMAETRVLIYSQNKFDFNSFRIVEKDVKPRKPKKINYFSVCDHIKSVCPKNLVIYRLRTNVEAIDPYSTKFGYFIKIDNSIELVYFDPVFAIKDLKHLKFQLDPDKFRFKIQQVGLQSVNTSGTEAVYEEVYSFDMRAIEAQFQNDRIFAEAIFALDPDFISEEEEEEKGSNQSKISELDKSEDDVKDSIADLANIKEDEDSEKEELPKFDLGETRASIDMREEKVNKLKDALGISEENEKDDPSENEELEFMKESEKDETEHDEDDRFVTSIDIIEYDSDRLRIDNPVIETNYSTQAETENDEEEDSESKTDPKISKKADKHIKKFEEAENREEYFYITKTTNTSDETEESDTNKNDEDFLDWNFSNPNDEDGEIKEESKEDQFRSTFFRKKQSEPDDKKLMKQLDVLDLFKSKKSVAKRDSVMLKFSRDDL